MWNAPTFLLATGTHTPDLPLRDSLTDDAWRDYLILSQWEVSLLRALKVTQATGEDVLVAPAAKEYAVIAHFEALWQQQHDVDRIVAPLAADEKLADVCVVLFGSLRRKFALVAQGQTADQPVAQLLSATVTPARRNEIAATLLREALTQERLPQPIFQLEDASSSSSSLFALYAWLLLTQYRASRSTCVAKLVLLLSSKAVGQQQQAFDGVVNALLSLALSTSGETIAFCSSTFVPAVIAGLCRAPEVALRFAKTFMAAITSIFCREIGAQPAAGFSMVLNSSASSFLSLSQSDALWGELFPRVLEQFGYEWCWSEWYRIGKQQQAAAAAASQQQPTLASSFSIIFPQVMHGMLQRTYKSRLMQVLPPSIHTFLTSSSGDNDEGEEGDGFAFVAPTLFSAPVSALVALLDRSGIQVTSNEVRQVLERETATTPLIVQISASRRLSEFTKSILKARFRVLALLASIFVATQLRTMSYYLQLFSVVESLLNKELMIARESLHDISAAEVRSVFPSFFRTSSANSSGGGDCIIKTHHIASDGPFFQPFATLLAEFDVPSPKSDRFADFLTAVFLRRLHGSATATTTVTPGALEVNCLVSIDDCVACVLYFADIVNSKRAFSFDKKEHWWLRQWIRRLHENVLEQTSAAASAEGNHNGTSIAAASSEMSAHTHRAWRELLVDETLKKASPVFANEFALDAPPQLAHCAFQSSVRKRLREAAE